MTAAGRNIGVHGTLRSEKERRKGKRTREKPRRKMLDLLTEQEDKKISYQGLKGRAEDRIQWHHHQLNLP